MSPSFRNGEAVPKSHLFRRFAVVAAIAIVAILAVAGLGMRYVLRNLAIHEAEDAAVHISDALSRQEMQLFLPSDADKGQLLSFPQKELPELDRRMRRFLDSFEIIKVKVYDTQTRIIYSNEPGIIGRLDPQNPRLAVALKGAPSSEYLSKDRVTDLADEQRLSVDVVETYIPIRNQGGTVVGCFEIYVDITEHYALADKSLVQAGLVLSITVLSVFAAIIVLMHRASSSVERSTAELERLAGELERSNRDLEQFASIASHDLQEPLRMVTGHLDLVSRQLAGKLDAQGEESLGFVLDGAQRMRALIRDLLAYARVGTQGKALEPTDAAAAAARAVQDLQPGIQEARAAVRIGTLPTVHADDTQLAQLFLNLIGNAIKYRQEGRTPQVHVGAEHEAGQWKFRVSDNGIGIPPEGADRIFMIFQRLHTRKEYPGTGMGLAICKRIVERHGGRIWVESRPGEGSTFYFTIPDASAGASAPADTRAENPLSAKSSDCPQNP